MTTKPIAPVTPLNQFPDTPKEDMQNLIHLNAPGYIPVLNQHFATPETTAVLSEFPIGWNVSQRRGLLSPDLLIVFDTEPASIIANNGYSIEYHGKPPDFVMEVASRHTARRDETEKRDGYAAYGVLEYWRYDDTDGRYYSVNLAGDRVVDGRYEPIPVREVSHARHWGYSTVLNLYICWEYGWLRWYDPAAQRYLPTYYDESTAREAAEAARRVAEFAREAAETAREAAETARESAETAREAAEAQLAAERQARLALEDQLRRLQDR